MFYFMHDSCSCCLICLRENTPKGRKSTQPSKASRTSHVDDGRSERDATDIPSKKLMKKLAAAKGVTSDDDVIQYVLLSQTQRTLTFT